MGRPGPAPDPRSINRNTKAEWTDVDDVPFDYEDAGRSLSESRVWHGDVLAWFDVVASLPHATLWRDGDWAAIYDLALIKQTFYTGGASSSLIGEMRQRENHLGLTEEARFKNRIRYVPVGSVELTAQDDEPDTPDAAPDGVIEFASARDRLRAGA